MIANIPVSIGELLDKISILKIKLNKIAAQDQLQNIAKELILLNDIVDNLSINNDPSFKNYMFELYETNNSLWNIEDRLRLAEKQQQFDDIFIEMARMVYQLNDKRAKIKKDINRHYNSEIIEEKSYNY